MPEDIKQLKKLPPEERLKRLQKYKQERETELKEADELIKKSSGEVEQKKKLVEKIPIPQLASENDERLSAEEREMFVVHRQTVRHEIASTPKKNEKKEQLEETVERERPKPVVEQPQYGMRPIREMYSEAAAIYQAVEQRGYITPQEMTKVGEIYTETQQKERANYQPQPQDVPLADRLHDLTERMQGIYRTQKERASKIRHGYSNEADDEPQYRTR